MKKIIYLIIFSIFIFNSSNAEKYWSNKKDGPTTIKAAKEYIYSKCRKIAPKGTDNEKLWHCVNNFKPLQGIWYSSNLGFVAIYPLSNDPDTSYKIKLIKAPRWMSDENSKSIRDHEGTTEGTIVQKGKNNYFGYNKRWYWSLENGSYKYESGQGKIILKSKNNLLYKREAYVGMNGRTFPQQDEYFYNIWLHESYDIIGFLKKFDKSRDISDYDIFNYANGGLTVRLDKEKEKKDLSGRNKFIEIDQDRTVRIGRYSYKDNDGSKVRFDEIICKNKVLYIRNVKTIFPKQIKAYCDPTKITYSTFLYYKYRIIIFILGALLLGAIIIYRIQFLRKSELANYNKTNIKKFKSYFDLKEFKQKIAEKERKAELLKQEKERIKEETKLKIEERRLEKEEKRKENLKYKESETTYDHSLMDQVKRLKRLYKNGTLSKAEFEKAKNKLLK